MANRVCIVGLDEPETTDLLKRLDLPVMVHDTLPRIVVREGDLLVESPNSLRFVPVAKIVFHGIFENDLNFITGLALWGGPCLPNAQAMMDCRLKFPCLVRALRHTRFGAPLRGYAGPGATFETKREHVAKWGNWHCGENKARFHGDWSSDEASIIEPFLEGQAVRVVVIGDRHWQIRLEGAGWLKSIHDERAEFMDADPNLLADTMAVGRGFGLEILANDYIVTPSGSKHLLEVNHIPNVDRFPEIWEGYRDYVVKWIQGSALRSPVEIEGSA